jgi:hypothetical protein
LGAQAAWGIVGQCGTALGTAFLGRVHIFVMEALASTHYRHKSAKRLQTQVRFSAQKQNPSLASR